MNPNAIVITVPEALSNLEALKVREAAVREARKQIDARPKPTFEYEVYYQGNPRDAALMGGSYQDGTQRHVVKAIDHQAALIESAKRSQHGRETYHIVVGERPARHSTDFDTRVVRRFKITNLGAVMPADYDFRVLGTHSYSIFGYAHSVPTQYYKVEQVF